MAPQPPPSRRVPLEGAANFRDLGGYAAAGDRVTRWGRLYRSDTLSELNAGDLEVLGALGVASVVDLRTPSEVERDGRAALADAHYVNLSVLPVESGESVAAPPGDDMAERYLWYLEASSPVVAEAMALVATPERLPLVFHCTAGKDRTGVVAGLVLDCLGVERSVVVADYAATGEVMGAILERLRRHPVYGPRIDQVPQAAYQVRAETMDRFLAAVDERYGGAAGWAASAGLGQDYPERLAALLLEAAPPPA